MEQIFVSRGGVVRGRWREAFPAARLVGEVPADKRASAGVLWLESTGMSPSECAAYIREGTDKGWRVVVMSSTPDEADAFYALGSGAVGYCHVAAAPEQLREVAAIVTAGGVWMLPELVQRLVRLSRRAMPMSTEEPAGIEKLTVRELSVARLVALGQSNREIAEKLEVSERTVKAHLTAIFHKLDVRDRVQLALSFSQSVSEGSGQ